MDCIWWLFVVNYIGRQPELAWCWWYSLEILCFYAAKDHTSTLSCCMLHPPSTWLVVVLFCFVDVVVVVLSLGSYHYPEPPSPQSPQRDPLGHWTNGTAARGHMTRIWRLFSNRGQRNRQTGKLHNLKGAVAARTLSMHSSDWTWPNSVYLRLWLQTVQRGGDQ